MTVRFLAQELYRWTQRVQELERAMKALPQGAPAEPRLALEAELRRARKEQEHFRAVLEAKKEQPMI